MTKQLIKNIALDSLILFLTSLPSVFVRCGSVLSAVIFILFTLLLSAAFSFFMSVVFKDAEQSLKKTFLPFFILSAAANVFCGIFTTFPFALSAAIAAFSKKMTASRKISAKTGEPLKFHPTFTVITVYSVCLALIYAITGVNI